MSKLNIGVGADFPLDDAPKIEADEHPCVARWRERHMHRRRHVYRHGPGPVAALFVLPAAAASVTAAILYPLTTLGVIGSLAAASALYRHRRRAEGDNKSPKPEAEQE